MSGISTLQMVILPVKKGMAIPKKATNFVKPFVLLNAFNQTRKTKIFIQIWSTPAARLEP